MEPNTDRMSFAIIALLIAGALAAALLTPGLPKTLGLKVGATTAAEGINFLQWLFSLIGNAFEKFINQAGKGTFTTIFLPKLY